MERRIEAEDLYSIRDAIREETSHLSDDDIRALNVWFGPPGPRGRMGSE